MAHIQPHHRLKNKTWFARARLLRKRIHSQLVSAVISATIHVSNLRRWHWTIIATIVLLLTVLPRTGLMRRRNNKKKGANWRFGDTINFLCDNDVVHKTPQVITLIANVTHSSDGIIAHGNVNTSIHTAMYDDSIDAAGPSWKSSFQSSALFVFKERASVPHDLIFHQDAAFQADSYGSNQPSLHELASKLRLGSLVAPSFKVTWKLPLVQDVMTRRDKRTLYRALGFPSASRIPPNYLIDINVYTNGVNGNVDQRTVFNSTEYTNVYSSHAPPALYSSLRATAVEPYEWRLRLPTTAECSRGKMDTFSPTNNLQWLETDAHSQQLDETCQMLTDGLMVLAVAGCSLPATSDILVGAQPLLGRPPNYSKLSRDSSDGTSFENENGNDALSTNSFRFGLPNCFNQHSAPSTVTVEVWKAYVEAVCPDMTEVVNKLRSLKNIQWGVARRAAYMASWAETSTSLHSACRKNVE